MKLVQGHLGSAQWVLSAQTLTLRVNHLLVIIACGASHSVGWYCQLQVLLFLGHKLSGAFISSKLCEFIHSRGIKLADFAGWKMCIYQNASELYVFNNSEY